MQITQIQRIKEHRIFRNYEWPKELPAFAKFNLIYGWNGSGKTTVSNLFRAIEKKQAIAEGDVVFFIDGKPQSGSTFANNPALPNVRVFNREYVEASVFKPGNELEPIFVLGEDSVEKQKEIQKLRGKLEDDRVNLANAQQAKSAASKAEDKFSSEKAVLVKDLLGGEATSTYRNYDKRNFRTKADALAKTGATIPPTLSEDEKQQLVLKQQEKPKEKIATVALALEAVPKLFAEVSGLLSTTIVARVIQHFVDHPNVAAWVEAGLGLHNGEGAKCEFCGLTLPEGRLAELEGHFNDQDKALKASLDELVDRIAADIAKIDRFRTPDKAALYADLASQYEGARTKLEKSLQTHRKLLSDLVEAVKSKRSRTFERLSMEPFPEQPEIGQVQETLTFLNSVIAEHNAETDAFEKRLTDARKALETHLVDAALGDYKALQKAIADASDEHQRLTDSIAVAEREIAKLDAEIAEHVRPAEELNRELRSYLGRDELVLKAEKKGYTITRHGFPALHLSEGEKTAIAFLHFLKSLESKDFNLATDIVVVDDPVSSLDSNAMFCAFAFLKERTKNAGQLFVLTHNFTFFSLVRKWFAFMKKDQRRHYMLETRSVACNRVSSIVQLDSSLERFHSEYHFLFSRIHAEAHAASPPVEIADLYALPNIARRFLETFLAFRRPGLSLDPNKVELDKKIADVASGFDPVKKARVLRFVQSFSHDNKIAEEEHDIFLLAEARDVLRDVLDLVASEDRDHFDGMLTAIGIVAPVS